MWQSDTRAHPCPRVAEDLEDLLDAQLAELKQQGDKA